MSTRKFFAVIASAATVAAVVMTRWNPVIADEGDTRLDALAPEITWYDLNESLVKEKPPEELCTVCYMLLQPGDGFLDLTVCCAGHPLPIVRRADGTLETACTEGTMLGAFHDPYLTDSRIRLEAALAAAEEGARVTVVDPDPDAAASAGADGAGELVRSTVRPSPA